MLDMAQDKGGLHQEGEGMSRARWIALVNDPSSRNLHGAVISLVLVLHLALHYSMFVPVLREQLVDSLFYQVHQMLETYFLIFVVYAALVFRLKGGGIALVVTAMTFFPELLAGNIAALNSWTGEGRDMAIQIGLLLMVGSLIVVFQEILAREREQRTGLKAAVDEANQLLRQQHEELGRLSQQSQTTHRLLTAMNQLAQPGSNSDRLVGEQPP